MKKAIINAKIIDGTKKARFIGHVIINDMRIEKILTHEGISAHGGAPSLSSIDTIIDGTGYILTPGFIDTHSHSDADILLQDVLEAKIRQGITTEILGQDGISLAPMPNQNSEEWRDNIAGIYGNTESLIDKCSSTKDYLNTLQESTTSSNYSYLIPHGNVRLSVLGLDDIQPSKEQLEKMKEIVRDAMKLGCAGMSTGLIYIPCVYSQEEELVELCKVVAEYNGIFVVHQRSEANYIFDSMDEIIRIGLKADVHIHFSHFKICGQNNWSKIEKVLAKLEDAKNKGLRVSFDMYPYIAGSTMLSVILPPWAHAGGTKSMLNRLQCTPTRQIIKEEIKKSNSSWDNFVEFAGLDGIYVTSVKSKKNEYVIGKSLNELGELLGKDPLDAAFDLLIDENNQVTMINFYGNEEHISRFLLRDEMNLCTDGIFLGMPHPRAYGSFPRLISEYVNKLKLLSLENAVYKMTYKPALLLGLKDRGIIKEGAYADLLLFDEDSFKDTATYLNPRQYPEGLKMVMVNGHIVFDGTSYHATNSGQLLKRGQ